MKTVPKLLSVVSICLTICFASNLSFAQDTESLIITQQGYVGIGNTNPLGKLHVPGLNGTPSIYLTGEDNIWFDSGQVRITTHDGYGNWQIKTGADNNDKYCGTANGAIKFRMDENGCFRFQTAPSGSLGSKINWNLGLFQDSAGEIGIDTVSPKSKLHIVHDNATTSAEMIKGGITLENKAFQGPAKVSLWTGWYTEGFLQVVVNDQGYFNFEEDGVFYESSDERIKENVENVGKSLDRLIKLRGVKYDYKEETNGSNSSRKFSKKKERRIGLIAQEVEEIYPELIFTDSKGFKSIAYTRLITPAIEAIKELKVENDTLKSENMSMEITINEIMDRLAALETKTISE